jgi:hypothetical protein
VKIEGLRIKNFKILQDITLRNLPNMAVFLGPTVQENPLSSMFLAFCMIPSLTMFGQL